MNFTSLVLGDSLSLLIDNRGKNPPYSPSGIPTVSGMSLKNGTLDLSVSKAVSTDTWEEWMPQPTRKHDVILTSEAPLGRVALVPDDEPLVLAQRVFGLRGSEGVLDSRYLYYALQTAGVQADLQSRATGTTVLGIRQPALMNVRIPAPTYAEQQAIAGVLGALDDNIAATTKLAETADQYLSALFTSMVSDTTGATFLGEIADVNAVTVKPRNDGQLRYIDIASVKVGWHENPDMIDWASAPSRARRGVRKGDTIWSTVRPNRRSHSLNLADDPSLVASTGLAILSPRDVGFAYLSEVTRRPDFTAQLENVAEGSTYPAVRADRFRAVTVPMLPKRKQQDFEKIAGPLRKYVHSLKLETEVLATIRDSLVPQLISGKLRATIPRHL